MTEIRRTAGTRGAGKGMMNNVCRAPDEPRGPESRRYVFITKPRVACPVCGGGSLKTTRSVDQLDGTSKRTTNCRTCGHHFFIIVE